MRLGDKISPPRLNNVVDKLRADNSYTVLAHKAWEQNLGEQPVKIAITDGEEQFGQFPIEGTLSLQLGRFTDIDAQFWINQFDSKGSVDCQRAPEPNRRAHQERTSSTIWTAAIWHC